MKVLVIYAHPKTTGHCAAIFREVTEYLQKNNVEFDALDLYQMKYDPILHEEELYTAGNRNMGQDTKDIQAKILAAQRLIFIYPVWWGSMPAILKGFFDRTLTSHFAFQYVKGIPMGLFKDKKALVFMATGASTWLSRIFQHDVPITLIKTDILGFCGVHTKVVQMGHSVSFTPEREAMIKALVPKELGKFLK